MRIFPRNLVLLFCLFSLLSGCGSSDSNTNQTTNKPGNINNNSDLTKDDIEELAKIVKLPFQPEEASWRESADKKIIAVMKFSATAANNLTSQIEKQKPAQNANLNAESWFPPELVAQSQQSGDESLKGKEYSAADFLLAPYTKGKITRIDETNYFVLELSGQ